jgi:hypothetical protein
MPAIAKPLRILAAAAIAVAGAGMIICAYALGLDNESVTGRDYIQYWAAERLLAAGSNPYDPTLILREQQAAGMTDSDPKVTLSPPVAFFFALPLGFVSAKTGLIAWLLVSLASLGLSVRLLWMEFGRPTTGYHFIGLCFPPSLSCLMAGQLGIFFLLGVAIFLRCNRTRPWLAGAALLPCALKPHLFLPLAAVLALSSLRRKDLRVPAGFLLTLAVSCALTLCIDPRIWSQYRQLTHSVRIMDVFLPTASVALRFAIDRGAHWIEFVPTAVACAWACWYFWTQRERWEWNRQGMLLLMVSLAAAPYSWFSDQTVLLPAVLAGIYAAEKNPRSWVLLALIAAGGMVGVAEAIRLTSPFYIWTAPAWLGWYLYAVYSKHGKNETGGLRSATSEGA